MKAALTSNHVKIIGRCINHDGVLLLPLSGCGIEYEYRGGDHSVTLIAGSAALIPENEENYARVAVYVDDKRIVDMQLTDLETVVKIPVPVDTDSSSRNAEEADNHYKGDLHRIRIIKLSEVAMSIVAIKALDIPDDALIRPTQDKELKIEFIGDSITCGYGVDDEDPLHLFKTATEDVTKAYAYKAANMLDADYSCFSASGYGIISGYTDDPDKKVPEELIPTYYRSLGLTYDRIAGLPATQDIKWDFSRFVPDVIVINLGTNDESYCQDNAEKLSEYTRLYVEFLKEVRSLNPEAYIVCTLGLMGDALFPYVEKAAADYSASSSDTRIRAVHLTPQDPEAGYVCDYHPLESAHEKAAGEIAAAIRNIIQGSAD